MNRIILAIKIEKLLSLVISYLAVYWIAQDFAIEAMITFLTVFIILIVLEIKETPSDVSKHDAELFKKIKNDLPSSGGIGYIKDLDIGGIFEIHRLDDLSNFVQIYSMPEYEFDNNILSDKKAKLIQTVGQFLKYWSENTFSVASGCNKIPDEWRTNQPDRYDEVKQQLEMLADNVVDSHKDFFKAANALFSNLMEKTLNE